MEISSAKSMVWTSSMENCFHVVFFFASYHLNNSFVFSHCSPILLGRTVSSFSIPCALHYLKLTIVVRLKLWAVCVQLPHVLQILLLDWVFTGLAVNLFLWCFVVKKVFILIVFTYRVFVESKVWLRQRLAEFLLMLGMASSTMAEMSILHFV